MTSKGTAPNSPRGDLRFSHGRLRQRSFVITDGSGRKIRRCPEASAVVNTDSAGLDVPNQAALPADRDLLRDLHVSADVPKITTSRALILARTFPFGPPPSAGSLTPTAPQRHHPPATLPANGSHLLCTWMARSPPSAPVRLGLSVPAQGSAESRAGVRCPGWVPVVVRSLIRLSVCSTRGHSPCLLLFYECTNKSLEPNALHSQGQPGFYR